MYEDIARQNREMQRQRDEAWRRDQDRQRSYAAWQNQQRALEQQRNQTQQQLEFWRRETERQNAWNRQMSEEQARRNANTMRFSSPSPSWAFRPSSASVAVAQADAPRRPAPPTSLDNFRRPRAEREVASNVSSQFDQAPVQDRFRQELDRQRASRGW
jgi:hypothetical protein